jgi:hypothetical protein
VTKRRHDLVETIPPGPQAAKKARAVRDRVTEHDDNPAPPAVPRVIDRLRAAGLREARVQQHFQDRVLVGRAFDEVSA